MPSFVNLADRKTAVYRYYDNQDRLLYVGVSIDPKRRFRDHKTHKWLSSIMRIEVHWFPNKAAAHAEERLVIHWERPLYNLKSGTKPFRAAALARRAALENAVG